MPPLALPLRRARGTDHMQRYGTSPAPPSAAWEFLSRKRNGYGVSAHAIGAFPYYLSIAKKLSYSRIIK